MNPPPDNCHPTLLDLIPTPVWISGMDSKWEYFNSSWLKFTGRTLEQETGQGWIEGIHPSDLGRFVKRYLDCFDSTVPFEMEYRMRDSKGCYRWISLHSHPIYDLNGGFSGYLGYCQDITDSKLVSETLRETRERFQAVAGISPVGIIQTDSQGLCRFVNQRWIEISNLSTEESLGHGWLKALHPDDRADVESRFVRGFEGLEEVSMECRFIQRDSELTRNLIQLRPETDDQGILTGYLGAVTDLTNVKQDSEEQLKISKFESLGILAGGIAHDFNNLLTPILLNLSIVRSTMPASSALKALHQRIEEAEQAALRARGLSQQLLTFAKGGHPIMKTVMLSELLEESVRFALHGSRIRLDLDIPQDLWPVKADVGQFSQVIQNVMINAAQSMENGGIIRVHAENCVGIQHPGIPGKDGKHVLIQIDDEGAGISPENLPKIFDPYFSTRINGNGLGLTTTLSIVRKHQGNIGVQSEEGRGTTFSLYLPATSAPPDRVDVKTHVPAPGKARLLIMDDEELILNSMRAMLTSLGYTVETAGDGNQALGIYREAQQSGEPFDVTLMDLTIQGGMGGKETVAELKAIDPHAIAVVCSGYSNDPIMSSYQDYGFSGAIQKPFKPEELHALLAEVMGG